MLTLNNINNHIKKNLNQQNHKFITNNQTLHNSHKIPQTLLKKTQKHNLKINKQLTFTTITFTNNTPQLTNIKTINNIYPIYNNLQTNPPNLKPQTNNILLTPHLITLLNLKTNNTININNTTLQITKKIIQKPNSNFNPFQITPHLIINLTNINKTKTIQPKNQIT